MPRKVQIKWPLTKLVEVEWQDACSIGEGWESNEDIAKDGCALPCKAIGYVLKSSKQAITLVMNQSITSRHFHDLTIPLGWVRKIRMLK